MYISLDKRRYLDSVVMDWKLWGDPMHPEEEITLYLDRVEVGLDDVFVFAKTPRRKSRGWMSLRKYISEGGDLDTLLNQMEEWRP